jgi:exodeoxyribonuclease VII large subunit
LMMRQQLTEVAQHGAFGRMMEGIHRREQKVDDLTHRMEVAERQLIERMRRRWENAAANVRHFDLRLVLAGMRRELETGTTALIGVMRNVLLQKRVMLDRQERALAMLSPLAILERGYALVFDESGKLVKDAGAMEIGQEISARMAKGEIRAKVTEKQS